MGKFVECDCLPCKLRDVLLADLPKEDKKERWKSSDMVQDQLLERNYRQIRESLLMLGSARAREVVYLLLQMHENDRWSNPDVWLDPQSEAVVELLAALSVLAGLQPVDFNASPQWTAWLGESFAVALLDGADLKHWTEMELSYKKRFEEQYYRPETRSKPVLLVALRSRGQVQPVVKPSWLEYTVPKDQNRLGDKDSFARSTPLRFYVCQEGLFDEARQATTIRDFLESQMRCVLE